MSNELRAPFPWFGGKRRAASRVWAAPEAERACLGVAVVRALLDDAPDRCVDLDRAVRDAARVHLHAVTEEHAATAARMVAVVLA